MAQFDHMKTTIIVYNDTEEEKCGI